MELNFKQLNLLSLALTVFYDEVCKTGTTPGMKKDLMELAKLVNDGFSVISIRDNMKSKEITRDDMLSLAYRSGFYVGELYDKHDSPYEGVQSDIESFLDYSKNLYNLKWEIEKE